MHEAGLIHDLVRKVERAAEAQGARRVTKVHVKLGALCHCSAAHFREHFEHACAGKRCNGAALTIEESDDPRHANAQDILLESIELEVG